MVSRMNKLLSVVLALLGCWSCNTPSAVDPSGPIDWEEATMVEYRYGDSSVAPDYHRSYVITITDSTKAIAIDSYGDVLLTKQYPNSPSDFQVLKDELSEKGIKTHKEKDSDGCSGGTSETLRLYKADVRCFDAYVYHCSGESGTLFLPDDAADLIREQIPESLDSLINSTMD